jgi:hypothetical protein
MQTLCGATWGVMDSYDYSFFTIQSTPTSHLPAYLKQSPFLEPITNKHIINTKTKITKPR